MRKYIFTFFAIVNALSSVCQDTCKNRVNIAIGGSFDLFSRLYKDEITVGEGRKFLDRDLKKSFDGSTNLQVGIKRKLTKQLYLGLSYNFADGRFTKVDGPTFNYPEYNITNLEIRINPKYTYYYKRNMINFSFSYQFKTKKGFYIEPSLGYGFGWIRNLKLVGIEYANFTLYDAYGYPFIKAERYEYATKVKSSFFTGFSGNLEVGYSFKKIEMGLNFNFASVKYSKVDKDGMRVKNRFNQTALWSMFSMAYKF